MHVLVKRPEERQVLSISALAKNEGGERSWQRCSIVKSLILKQ